MATFEVNIHTIEVFPHTNADRLELAQVGLFKIVVEKGLWKTGDKVFYIPEFSIVPENIIELLGLTGKLAGKQHNRVQPVRLRGELSQGIVAPLSLVSSELLEERGEKADYADVLGVEKWEPEIPLALAGDVEARFDLVPWIEIENIKMHPDTFQTGELVNVTEKIHGTCSCFTVVNPLTEPELIVTSKGLGKGLKALKDSETNVYWRMARQYDVTGFGTFVAEKYANENILKVAIFGETYGVQDLKYGATNGKPGFMVFDIYLVTVEGSRWLNPTEVEGLTKEFGIPHPPVLFSGEYDLNKIAELASGKEQVSGEELHIREGVIVRPAVRSANKSERIIKFISDAYLTRKNGTEFN